MGQYRRSTPARETLRGEPQRRGFLKRLTMVAGAAVVGGATVRSVPASAGVPMVDTYVPNLDDRPAEAINDAIKQASLAGGGVVYIREGQHDLDGAIVMRSHVTLRGVSMTGSVLRLGTILHEEGVEGATVEDLTLDGGEQGIGYTAAGPAETGASFCMARRLRIMNTVREGVQILGGSYHHLYFEELFLENCGGDAFVLDADESCESVFLAVVSIGPFAVASEGGYAVRLGCRSHINQLQIDPVTAGQVGVGFLAGSDYTTLSNFYIRTEGGEPFAGQNEREGVVVGPHQIDSS